MMAGAVVLSPDEVAQIRAVLSATLVAARGVDEIPLEADVTAALRPLDAATGRAA
jgi:hypothetical protein